MGWWNCVILIWNIGKGIKDITRGPQDQKIQVCINYIYDLFIYLFIHLFIHLWSFVQLTQFIAMEYCMSSSLNGVDNQSVWFEGGNFVPIKTQEVVLVWWQISFYSGLENSHTNMYCDWEDNGNNDEYDKKMMRVWTRMMMKLTVWWVWSGITYHADYDRQSQSQKLLL